MCWSRKDIVWYKSHCGSWTWLESSAEVPVGSSMLDTFLTLLNLSTSCVHWVVTSSTVQSSKMCEIKLGVCLHSDVFVGFGVCIIETWVFLDSFYQSLTFFITPFPWRPEMDFQHIISSEQNCFETESFSLVTSFWVTWSSSTGTFFNTWRRHNEQLSRIGLLSEFKNGDSRHQQCRDFRLLEQTKQLKSNQKQKNEDKRTRFCLRSA